MILGKPWDILNLFKLLLSKSKACNVKELQGYINSQTNKLAEENVKPDFEQSDDLQALQVLLNTCDTLESVETKVISLFGENITDKVIISTVHKSKGLEATNVYVNMAKLPMVHETIANNEDMIFQEKVCLPYVAFTRAKENLITFCYEKTSKGKDNEENTMDNE